MKKILVAGGTGLVGTALINELLKNGYHVNILTRKCKPGSSNVKYYEWDIDKKSADNEAFEDVEVAINLAGENVAAKKWTTKQKQRILQSRVDSNSLLYHKFKAAGKMPKLFVSASGTDIYNSFSGYEPVHEDAELGESFLAEVCKKWEQSAKLFENEHVRCVIFRIGMVISHSGGALPKMTATIKYGLAIIFGSGNQLISWIHLHDLCSMFVKCISDTSMHETYNAVAPNSVTFKEFIQTYTKMIGRWCLMIYLPDFFVKFVLGEMSDILLNGRNVSCKRILETGFQFQYRTIESAFRKN